MAQRTRGDVRNLAVIGHVDHGKTSLLDAMLVQCELLAQGVEPESLLRTVDPGREKAIPIMPRMASVDFRGTRLNLVDTPYADLGGEAERTLQLVEGVLLLVDACEGPPLYTRFVLRKALEARLAPVVVINKIDLPAARPEQTLEEIRALFVDLDADAGQLDFPVLYSNARKGVCRPGMKDPDGPLVPLLETIVKTVPGPSFDPEASLQVLVTSLDYDDFLGRLALGRVVSGRVENDRAVAHCRKDGSVRNGRITGIYGYAGLARTQLSEARAGEIVSLTATEPIHIGETIADVDDPRPLAGVAVDEPTLAIALSVNDSPTAGLEATHTAGADLRERLWRELATNSAVKVEETDSPDAFRLAGRGELQLAILIEMMRREGYEMLVGRPEVLSRVDDGERMEPVELLIVDCPERFAGVVTEKVAGRSGRMIKMLNHGTGRVRMEFHIPTRGLIGFRSEFLSDTKGTGILQHRFESWQPAPAHVPEPKTGALVADRPGRATAHAIAHLQQRGTIFVEPGDQIYEGMVVGEHSRPDDIEVNITKARKPSGLPGVAAEPPVRLVPPRSLSLEQALELIDDDEVVEVTPRSLRLRKRVLSAAQRGRKV